MNTLTISFAASLVGIVVMISTKAFEIKKGKKIFAISFISRFAEKTNRFFQSIYDSVDTVISYVHKHNAIALIQWIAYHILSWIRSLYLKVREKAHAHPPSKKVIDMVRGKGEVHKKGGASFYLKRISDDGPEKMKR